MAKFVNVLQPNMFAAEQPRRAAVPRPPVKPAVVDLSHAIEPPPPLNGEKRIILNAETTGLKWWASDRPCGWSYFLPESGRKGYLPIRHGGGNLPIERVQDWLRDIRGMHVENQNTRFDLHMSREDGVDLVEGTGNTFGDCAHYAALLDDNRARFSLDILSKDYLGWDVTAAEDPLGKLPPGVESEADWHAQPSWVVAPYAIRNVEQVQRLIDDVFLPQIDDEDLFEVLGLEQDIIPVVVEMEKNGTYLDTDLLYEWQKKATSEMEQSLFRIHQLTGLEISSPDSSKDIAKLFKARGIPITQFTEHGAPSFTDAVLRSIDDECVIALRKAGQLADLKSKYLDKYAEGMRSSDGWLRFNLHQLRYSHGESDMGTVSGRFSASGDRGMRPDGLGTGGYNPQQVVAVEKQLERGWCSDYVVRKLFKMNFAADMMQIEYRLFANLANAHQVYHDRAAFKKDAKGKIMWIAGPLADFHAAIAEHLQKVNPALNRKLVKNINFATIYGAGLLKFTMMIGLITEAVYESLLAQYNGRPSVQQLLNSPYREAFKQSLDIRKAYDSVLTGVHALLDLASRTAKNRGYVRTLMGRRARLLGRFHSALNRIIQGGAADVNKRYLVEAYKHRKELGLIMRLTVHDELAGTLMGPLGPMKKLLNTQLFDLKVPVLWDCNMGANWAACK